MTPEQRRLLKKDLEELTRRDGSGRFAPVDLSLKGVNEWRAKMGLPPLDRPVSETR